MKIQVTPDVARPLTGAVAVPGDKSIGHRSVLFSALAQGTSTIRGLGGGEDNHRTVVAMGQLGARIERHDDGTLTVQGVGSVGALGAASAGGEPLVLDCGNSGTSMRLLAGLLAGARVPTTLVGDQYLHRRPMKRVAEPLGRMGARIEGAMGAKPGELYPPLRLAGTSGWLRAIDYTLPVASAQVKSAVLLAGLSSDGPVTVREPGPTRDHTERMLRALGVPLTVTEDGAHRIVVLDPTGPGVDGKPWSRSLRPAQWQVPGDISSAAFLWAAAAITPGSDVTVLAVGVNPTRTGVLDALRRMGAQVELLNPREVGGEPVADVRVRGGAPLRGVELGGALVVRAIDEIPIVSAVAATAQGETIVRDAEELRVKETDRIAAMVRELTALGVQAEERPDGLRVVGGAKIRGAEVNSHGDHRIAMACAVLALRAQGATTIFDADNVATSFPTFVTVLRTLGAQLEQGE
jgi:3-phosphoshikimate 1-carboxyvinyltransferase